MSWILHHDYLGALPANSLVDGWRFRCGDIQIGDNGLLQTLFPESRFNGWCVAETHVLDPRILPNGRRDHFEQNTYYFDLMNDLTLHAKDIAQRCRSSSVARNLLRSIDDRLIECHEDLRVIDRGMLSLGAVTKLKTKVAASLDHLERLSARSGVPADKQSRYHAQIKRLRQRLTRLNADRNRPKVLLSFTPIQRTVLTEVCNAIYQSTGDLRRAQGLIDKILSRLKRSHVRRKAPRH